MGSGTLVGPAVELDSPSPLSAMVPDLVLLNPAAGGGIANDAAPRLQQFAAEIGWRVNFRVTISADDLAAQAHAGLAAGYTRMLALGGDGTFQQLANANWRRPKRRAGRSSRRWRQ